MVTGIANTSSTPIGWESGVQVGSPKVASRGYVFTKTSQMASISAIFTLTYHTKQLNPWPNSSTSHGVNYVHPAVCLPREYYAANLKTTLTFVDI